MKVTLNNGMEIPSIGFGSPIVLNYRNHNDVSLKRTMKYWTKNLIYNRRQFDMDRKFDRVLDSLESSKVEMIDTSRAYGGSEYCIGKMLKKHGREKFTIITKLRNTDQYRRTVRDGLIRSLKELDIPYVDMYLMHWPVTDHYLDTWREMEWIYREGLCKSIGVCNCNRHHLEQILEYGNIVPAVNEIECHPLFTQNVLRNFCQKNSIHVIAYTATARMDERIMKTCIPEIAQKYNKSVAQIILRWHTQLGNVPLVNSWNANHIRQNFDIFDFSLTEEELSATSACNINSRLRYDPDNCDFSKL